MTVRETIDLGFPVGRLTKQDKNIYDELLIISPHDNTENFGFQPAQCIGIWGEKILNLRDFLNKNYPVISEKQ